MKSNATDLGTPRRMFLAVLVVLALVLAWNLSKPWRTGIGEHRTGSTYWDWMAGRGNYIIFGTNSVQWRYDGEGTGWMGLIPGGYWEFAPYERKELRVVTSEDTRFEFFGPGSDGFTRFGTNWRTNALIIKDGQIIFVRLANATQTVYALQAVEQRDGRGFFRSRKILPAPESR